MTFDNVNVTANELFGVKVSFGNEIRRASCNDYSYAALCELVAKLFGIDPTASSLLIKYQDVDGDNITMSSDAEVRDAVQLAKEAKKTLRLIVEVKAAKEVPAEPVAPPAECPPESESDGSQSETAGWGMGGFGHRWPHHSPRGGRVFHHRGWGGFPHHGPHHGFPHHGPHHGFPHHGFGPNGFPHRGFGPHGFPHPGPGEFPCAPGASRGGPTAQGSEVPPPFAFRFGTPCVFGHGVFSPAPEAGTTAAGNEDWKKRREDWDAMRKAWKSRKCAMKETLRAMKESASTPEDKLAIKEFKATMKAECKSAWKECKDLKRSEKENKKSKNKEEHRLLCKHVADVTIPDNSELTPDTPVVKTWKLKNAGNVEWPAGSQLLFISKKGDNLNGPEKVVLEHAVLPQAEVEVSVPFITPSAPGRYIGYYRMATPDFVKFGPRMWVAFVIAGTANATTTTVPTAPPAHHHLYPHLHPLSPHSPHHAHPHGGRGQGGQGDAMVQ